MSRSFDGIDDVVAFGDLPSVRGATSLTFAAWVYLNGTTADQTVFSNIQPDNSIGIWLLFDDVGAVSGRTNTYTIFIADAADTDSARVEGATNAAVSGSWQRVAFTFQASSTTGLRLYVDGSEDANSPASTSTIASLDPGGAVSHRLGLRPDAGSPLGGLMAHAQIWTRVLGLNEINQALRYPGSISNGSHVYVPLWGSGSPEPDYSGNIKNGTVTGATAGTTEPPINGIFQVPSPNLYYPSFSSVVVTAGTATIKRMMLMGVS